MFEPFITSKPEGIGLGLALAKAAAEEHGGSLTFARFDGQTRFTMSLAAERPRASATTEREMNLPTAVAAASLHGESRVAAENSVRD